MQDLHGQKIFQALSTQVAAFLNLSDYGAHFLFGNLSNPQYANADPATGWPGLGSLFAFKVLACRSKIDHRRSGILPNGATGAGMLLA